MQLVESPRRLEWDHPERWNEIMFGCVCVRFFLKQTQRHFSQHATRSVNHLPKQIYPPAALHTEKITSVNLL